MPSVRLNIAAVTPFLSREEINALAGEARQARTQLLDKSGAGNDFLGWVDLPSAITEQELAAIADAAADLGAKSDILVVVGIGGSYLGARAVIDALAHNFNFLLDKKTRQAPLVLFAGQNIGEDYTAELLDVLAGRDFSVVNISKSGTTTEPALAFRFLKKALEERYGKKEAAARIIAVTDRARGALKQLADSEGYRQFVIPDDVGGRFSVLTPVGLLPIAAAGFDIRKLVAGARAMEKLVKTDDTLEGNPALLYAAVRNALYRKGFKIEILANYSPNLHYITEWWKQLYGESEGKNGKGIFPAGVDLTSDLHSMGQLIQDGERTLFETVLAVGKTRRTLTLETVPGDPDGLNYLAGKRINEVNGMAMVGTKLAHVDGGVPNLLVEMDRLDEETLGGLLYFFEAGCGISGYMLGVNPFDQPGVEAYKKNMFALLGKPGFEEATRALRARL